MMLDLGNFWADPIGMNSYHAIINQVHVLLVEHETDGLLNTSKMLEMCQYRVTLVEFASAAISMLISGKTEYDVVIANIHSPDLHGFKLLQQAVTAGLPTLVMSNDDNTYMAMRALENGAFLYVKKPLTVETLKCLWQHAVREKTRMIRERERDDTLPAAPNGVDEQNLNTLESMVMSTKNKGKWKKNIRDKDNIDEELTYDYQNHRATNNNNVKRKMCTEWTQELHEKFMAAVEELGEGRCFPKEILELMNVPGLTRMQVASHLQKCRNANWRSPLERKSQQATQPVSSDPNGPEPKPRRFGSKPLLKTRSDQTHDPCGPELGAVNQSEYVMPNYGTPPSYHHQQLYGPMGPGPLFAQFTANHRHSGEEFFSFQDVECLIQNFSGLAHGTGLYHPSPAQCAYNFSPTYYEQNSGGPGMESRSQWSSDTSNFESDQSAETRGHAHA